MSDKLRTFHLEKYELPGAAFSKGTNILFYGGIYENQKNGNQRL